MIVSLELSPEEHAALERRARAGGISVEAVLRGLVAALARADAPPVPAPAWEGDDAEDAEERAERDRERAEIAANVRRWRAERGEG